MGLKQRGVKVNQSQAEDPGSDAEGKIVRTCKCCRQPIDQDAAVCHHCSRHQNWIVRNLANAGFLIAVIMMFIAYQQLSEAKKQRIAASDALSKASKAENTANAAATDITGIQTRVKTQEASISEVASSAIEAKQKLALVQELLNKTQMDVKMATGAVGQAEIDLKRVREASEFGMLLVRASNDDRKAFDMLRTYAVSPGHPLRKLSSETIELIIDKMYPPVRLLQPDREIAWDQFGVDPSRLTSKAFYNFYKSSSVYWRPSLLAYFWKSDHYSKFEKLELTYEVIKTDDSLNVLDGACRFMNAEAKINKNILDATEYLRWWEGKRSNYR